MQAINQNECQKAEIHEHNHYESKASFRLLKKLTNRMMMQNDNRDHPPDSLINANGDIGVVNHYCGVGPDTLKDIIASYEKRIEDKDFQLRGMYVKLNILYTTILPYIEAQKVKEVAELFDEIYKIKGNPINKKILKATAH